MTLATKVFPCSDEKPVAIGLEQPDASVVPVDLTIKAKVAGQILTLSRAVIPAPTSETPSRGGRRLVAYADVPGASEYTVVAQTVGPEALAVDIASGIVVPCVMNAPVVYLQPATPVPPLGNTQPALYAWVANNGDDATASVGDITKPYLTIGAAAAAARALSPSRVSLLVCPGSYKENVSLDANAGLLANFSIIGLGKVRWGGGIAPCLRAFNSGLPVANQNFSNWSIENIEMTRDDGGNAIAIEGAADLGTNPSLFSANFGGLTLKGCNIKNSGFFFRFAGLIVLFQCTQSGGAVLPTVDTCQVFAVSSGSVQSRLNLGYDASQHRGDGRGPYLIKDGASMGGITFSGAPSFADEKDVSYNDLVTTGLMQCYNLPGDDIAPDLSFSGNYSVLNINMPAEIVGAAARPAFSANFAKVNGAFSVRKDASQPYRMPAPVKNAILNASASFDENVNGDLTGSSYNPSALFSSLGATVKRPVVRLNGVALAAGANAIVIDPPQPDGNYTVLFGTLIGAQVEAPPGFYTGAGFTVNAVAGTVADLVVIRESNGLAVA